MLFRSIFINAGPERIWQAITSGDDTAQYYYGTRVVSDWQPGSHIRYEYPDGTAAADGDVIAVDPPRRLEMSFLARWDPEIEAEGPVRQVWQLEAADAATKLTVTTFGLRAGSRMADEFGNGMIYIVSGLKTHLEQAAVPTAI